MRATKTNQHSFNNLTTNEVVNPVNKFNLYFLSILKNTLMTLLQNSDVLSNSDKTSKNLNSWQFGLFQF
jgi:hypothetical protein